MYGQPLEQGIAALVQEATSFRFDASDLMPQEVGQGTFWSGMTDWVSGAADLPTVMAEIDASWPHDGDMPMEDGGLGTADNPLIWVLVPSQDTDAVLAGAEEIAAAIEEATGIVIEPLVTTDFSGAVEAMCNGEAHLGALNTFNYILANARDCANVEIVSVRFGSSFYAGQLITRADSGITSIEDLAGKTFCRPDPTSTSGWVIPSIAMQAAGINPETDLAEIVDAGGHDGVVLAVYNGDCEAGSTFVDARGNIAEEYPDVLDVVVVIEESAPIPNDNISFAPDLDQDLVASVVAALLDLTSTEEGLALLNSVYSWSGMEATGDDFYDGFRQQLEAAGLSIDDLIK
jgi:phosphonate transport system substrate-binding protein